MGGVLSVLLYLCVALAVYTWLGYPVLLMILRRFVPATQGAEEWPEVTILLTVRNEAASIASRLRNILEQDYPAESLHVFVACDGCTDGTPEMASAFGDGRIMVKQFPHGGKSPTQNAAIAEIKDPIVVFTDAGARFAPNFLRELVAPFFFPEVGCVSGSLIFADSSQAISSSQSLYWRYETWLRREESVHGLLATASGAAMACRRALLRPLMAKCGEDCTVPLDVVAQGYKVVHSDRAVAYDAMPATLRGELRARARMTSRNLRGTIAYKDILNPFRHPGYALSLWSHKIFRWMTPLFLGGAFVFSVINHERHQGIVLSGIVFLICAGIGALFHAVGQRQPRIFSAAFSFLLANIGFLFGIVRFVRGNEPVSYVNVTGAEQSGTT
jgi:cellulose synthase/poly-beta-1,6-N-acetylglucosamine synthase-like glycosyltransferase